MSLHDFAKVVRQRWIVILLATLVAAAVMFAVTPARRDTTQRIGSYTATATVLYQGGVSPGRIALFITTGEIPRRAAAVLNYSGDPALLASGLTVEPDAGSGAVKISTTASDGNRAAEVANAFAREAVAYFKENPAGAGGASLTILQEATPIPNRSTSGFVIPPDRSIRTALAALLGLLFGVALALLLDRLDSRLRSRGEVSDALRMPVIAEVPRLKRSERQDGTILAHTKPLSIYADGYRAARTALVHLRSQQVPDDWSPRRSVEEGASGQPAARVILISSAHAAEGKTTTVANLAASFAETGKNVLVLDADLRSPDTHTKFDVPQGAGISDYLTDPAGSSLELMMRPTNVRGVQIVTAGTRLDYPASLASRMAPLMAEARSNADIVLIDTSPLLAASDVFDILPLADTIAIVVRSGRLTENAASRVAELLGRFRVPVTGAILIGAPVRKADYGYGGGYGYGDGYGENKERGRRRPSATADSVPTHVEEPPADAAARRSR